MLKMPAARPAETLRTRPQPAGRLDLLAGMIPLPVSLALSVIVCVAALLAVTAGAGAAPSKPAGGDGTTDRPLPGGATRPPAAGDETASLRRKPVRLASLTRRARFGARVKVRGSSGLAGASRVRVQFRPFGHGRWGTRIKTRSSPRGRFHTRFRAIRSGLVRILDRSGRSSRTARLIVRSRIHLNRPRRTVKLGGRLKLSGSVRPRGVRWIRIRVTGSGRVAVVRSRPSGRFSYRWRPRRAGDVRIRAQASGNRQAARSRSERRRSSALRPGGASFYGPGLYGNGVACGGTLMPGTIGVAHRTLPCGTRVKFMYRGRVASARVIDRGPYVAGRDWDLTAALRNRLGFGGVGTVWTNR